MGNDSLFPIPGCAQLTAQPFQQQGINQGLATRAAIRDLCPVTVGHHFSSGPAWDEASSHCPAPPRIPGMSIPKHPGATQTLSSAPGAPLQPHSTNGAAPVLFSLRETEAGACPRSRQTLPPPLPKRAALPPCQHLLREGVTAPGHSRDVPGGSRAPGSPRSPRVPKIPRGFSELQQPRWGNSQPSSSSSRAPWFSPCRILGAERSMGGSSIPTELPHCCLRAQTPRNLQAGLLPSCVPEIQQKFSSGSLESGELSTPTPCSVLEPPTAPRGGQGKEGKHPQPPQ